MELADSSSWMKEKEEEEEEAHKYKAPPAAAATGKGFLSSQSLGVAAE